MIHFGEHEFLCKCDSCSESKPEQFKLMLPEIIEDAEAIREELKQPVRINSAYRCLKHPLSIKKIDSVIEIKEKFYRVLEAEGKRVFEVDNKFYTYAIEIDNHSKGYAIDLSYKGMNNLPIIDAIKKGKMISNFQIIHFLQLRGIQRIGIHELFIHIDRNPLKLPAIWLY